MKKWIVAALSLGIGFAASWGWADQQAQEKREQQHARDVRNTFVFNVNRKLGRGMRVMAVGDDTLEVIAADCGPNMLRMLRGEDTVIINVLDAGFHHLACEGGRFMVDLP